MHAQAFKVGMRAPDDVSDAARLLDAGAFRAEHVVAILGKTEGNGGVNDYTRGLATLSFQLLLAERTGQQVSAIAKRVPIIWSGGTEGLMSPHATIFTREPDRAARYRGYEARAPTGRANVGGTTRPLVPWDGAAFHYREWRAPTDGTGDEAAATDIRADPSGEELHAVGRRARPL